MINSNNGTTPNNCIMFGSLQINDYLCGQKKTKKDNEANSYSDAPHSFCTQCLWAGTDREADGGSADGPVGKHPAATR